MQIDLSGRVAVVTGGSQGLGRGIAHRLAESGAQVVIASRDSARVRETAQELSRATGREVVGIQADITSTSDVRNLIGEAVNRFGRLHILVANGGGPRGGRFEELTLEDWERAFRLNLLSYVQLIQEALPHMRKEGWGRILTITTSGIFEPIPRLVLSNAFRSAVWAMLKTLADEVADGGIRVFNLAPGRFDTERVKELDQDRAARTGKPLEEIRQEWWRRIPLGRYGDPLEMGNVAAFLCSDAASYLTGITVPVDGGLLRGT